MPKEFAQKVVSGGDNRVVKWAPWGSHIPLTCTQCGAHFSTKNIQFRNIFPGYGPEESNYLKALECDMAGHAEGSLKPDPEYFDKVHQLQPGYEVTGYDGNGDVESIVRAQEAEAKAKTAAQRAGLRKRLEERIPIGTKLRNKYKTSTQPDAQIVIRYMVVKGFKDAYDENHVDVIVQHIDENGKSIKGTRDTETGAWILNSLDKPNPEGWGWMIVQEGDTNVR
jgi:hypothetical protein